MQAVALAPIVAVVAAATAPSDAADPAPPASVKAPGVHVVRTICPDGQTPTPNHSGCWCGDDSMPPTSRMVAPAPTDPTCWPTERAEGPYCLWTCGHPAAGSMPPKAPAKPAVSPCHNGLGKPVACISDDDFACAVDDYQWKPSPGGPCDSPPGPADRVYHSAEAAAPPAPTQPPRHAETLVPPAMVGEVYVAVDYNKQAGHLIATSIAVVWGSWQHHAVSVPAPGARGFVLKLHHATADSVPLLVATDGAIVAGPMQSAPLRLPGYAQIQW